jgi:4'-phosphopantetheinyl transferase EntD
MEDVVIPRARPIAELPGLQLAEIEIGKADPSALTREERAIHDAISAPVRRAEWLAGRLCARGALRALGAGAASVLADERGAPMLKGIGADRVHLSITHGRRLAAAVASSLDGLWPRCGVDLVDEEDGRRLEKLEQRVFDAGEIALACGDPRRRMILWGAREAIAKATSTGMFAFGLHEIRVEAIEEGRAQTSWEGAEVRFWPREGGILVVAAASEAAYQRARERVRRRETE